MKKSWLVLPLLACALMSCGEKGGDEGNGGNGGGGSSVTPINLNVQFAKADPAGWTYLGAPQYSAAYGSTGYFNGKFTSGTDGFLSPEFSAQNKLEFSITVEKWNQNTKTEKGGDHEWTIQGLKDGQVVDTAYIDFTEAGTETCELEAAGMNQVKFFLTAYHHDGTKYCNTAVTGVSVVTK